MSYFVKCPDCGQAYPTDKTDPHRTLTGEWCPSPSTPRTEPLPPHIAKRLATTNEQPCDHGKPFAECAPCLYAQLIWERDGVQAYCDSENAARLSLAAACAERDAALEAFGLMKMTVSDALDTEAAACAEAERLRGEVRDILEHMDHVALSCSEDAGYVQSFVLEPLRKLVNDGGDHE